jgi:hypothetical protein
MEQWIVHHQLLVNSAVGLFLFIIGWALPNDKITAAGVTFSAFVRRLFGKKLDEKIESVGQTFIDGMKKDDDK